MTREEAIKELKILKEEYWDDDGYGHETKQYDDTMLALDMAIKALEQEPCDDAISRQAVEEITWEEPSYTDALNVLTEVRDKVRALPSVTPQQKTGCWNRVTDNAGYCVWECDKCGWQQRFNTNYCPDCGAKKQEEEENDD